MMHTVKFKSMHPDAIIPMYHSPGAAGFDFHAIENTVVYPRDVVPVRTGLSVELPPGTVLLITPRSGFSIDYPTYVSNAPGVVDEDYRGEIKVLVVAWDDPIGITKGLRFAQGVIVPYLQPRIVEAQELKETARGTDGFGSTGR